MVNLIELQDEKEWAEVTFSKVEDRLRADGLIKRETIGGSYKITSQGILEAEQRGIPPEKLVQANQRIRTIALDTLTKAYEENGMSNCNISLEYLIKVTDSTKEAIYSNLLFLADLNYVEIPFKQHFKITYSGIEAVEKWRRKLAFVDKFESVERMSPHARGREFQKLFAEIVERDGWMQEEGIRTTHEEMDVIIYQGREYYLIECKWEKDPIEASVIREIYGKLGNRVGMEGIVVSMSGFTRGAVGQVDDYKNKRVILLFGPNDVQSMIFERASFEDLLNQKFRVLVTRKKVLFE